MKITSQAHMPANATRALGQEIKELKKGAKASAFKLKVTGTPPQVTSDEIRRLLSTARASKKYKENIDKYQFKLVGRTLQLKEEGFFSKLKVKYNIGRDQRDAQRGHAAILIQNAFVKASLETNLNVPVQDRITHDDAVQIQKELMLKSELAPGLERRKRRGADASSESATWEKLMADDHDPVSDSPLDNVISYEVYDEQARPALLLQSRQVSGPLASSPDDVQQWLDQNQVGMDAHREAVNPHASWQNSQMINPMPADKPLFQDDTGLTRYGSLASVMSESEMNLFELLLKKR